MTKNVTKSFSSNQFYYYISCDSTFGRGEKWKEGK